MHLEIQNQNHEMMPERMLSYLTDIRLSHLKQMVCQYLLYIGKAPLAMADGLQTGQLQYRYPILDMHSLDYRFFMQQNSADALVLAVLCDFNGVPPRIVVHEIVTRLIDLTQ